MCSHFIILSSSYSAGERIALDFTDFSKDINSIIKRIKQECGEDVSISTHGINADDTTWEGVKRADPFFQDVRLIKNVDEFIRLIKQDRILSGTDIAKYILSVVGNCTHLKLEKLVYFCYADYICGTGKKLFKDKIFAYKLGPVVESVYQQYKSYGKETIDDTDENFIPQRKDRRLSSRSRILFSEDGVQKMVSIITTLKKYGLLTASHLVELTHSENSPWSHYDSTQPHQEMEDDIIKKYHSNESL